jgi:hypothetical protein
MKLLSELRHLGKRSADLWRGIRARRRTARSAARFLRPGVYFLVSETLWTRSGAEVPSHLARTKGGPSSKDAPVSRMYRLFRRAAGMIIVIGSRRGRGADLVVASFDGGTVVLDRSAQRVYRTYGSGVLTPQDEERRRRFTEHVSAPSFRFLEGGAAVEEELVDGDHLGDLTAEERTALLTTLVEQFADLTSSYTEATASVSDDDLDELLQYVEFPPGFAELWKESVTSWLSPDAPWVPTPREANAKNLVVRPDGRPAPIDLGDLQVDPYFVYPVGILIAAGQECVQAFLRGSEEYSMSELMASAGRRWNSTEEERRGLLLTRIVYASHKDSLIDGAVDRRLFEESLLKRWDEVRDAFASQIQEPTGGSCSLA